MRRPGNGGTVVWRVFAALLAMLGALGVVRCGDLERRVPLDLDADGDVPDVPDAPGDGRDARSDAGVDTSDLPDTSDDSIDQHDGDVPSDPDYIVRIDAIAALARVQDRNGVVKYLLEVDGRSAPAPFADVPCVFQNTERFPWHIQFLQSFPELSDLSLEAYTDLVLADGARVWWGGALQPWPSVRHPISGEFGIYSFLIYGDPQGEATVTVDQIGEVYETLRSCAPALAELLVFVPGDIRQQDMVRRNEDAIRDAGLPFLMPNQLADGAETIGYSEGEGYGTLRIIPQGELLLDYGPRDVVVVEAAPNDISIVSGLVTAQPQNPASHVNLRLSEKGIPNAMLASAYESPWLRELDGQLVHIVVGENQVRIDPARLEDAEAFWEANQPDVPDPVSDLSVTALTPYADMGADDALAFGAKAANLAEIRNVLPPEHRVEGFAIPFGRYQEHLERNGIDNLIATRLADPRMTTDAAFKADALDEIRDAIRDTPLDPAFESALHAQLRAVYGDAVETRRIRFRSSTNVEDLDALTGAGLYDSRSGCLADDLDGDRVGPSHCLDAEERAFLETRLAEKQAELAEHPERTWLVDIIADIQGDLTEEKPVADAVRKVWRSMWNLRAFDERAYYGIAHTDAYMGIAVNPSFVLEQINAVGFTGLEDADGGQTLYRVVSQRGDESVVRPDDPTVVAEVLAFNREPDDTASEPRLLVESSLSEGGSLWSEADFDVLAGLLFTLQDHFSANVYPDISPLRLDVEIKLDRDGEVVIKQARPFVR